MDQDQDRTRPTTTILLTSTVPDEVLDRLAGRFLDDQHYCQVIDHDARVLRPDGTTLLVFRKGVLDRNRMVPAHQALRAAATPTFNRGMAAGLDRAAEAVRSGAYVHATEGSKVRLRKRWKDGTASRNDYSPEVASGMVGFYDRSDRLPYCRLTRFNLERPKRFAAALPLIRRIDEVFRAELPDRYAAQAEVVSRTHPDFTIHGTAFTTITVNKNFRTACHKDAGDLKAGFGVMCCFERGRYDGGLLVFPKYRVAVDMRAGDLLLADVHEWHGNTPIVPRTRRAERLSLVLYYRARMTECGAIREELARAKQVIETRRKPKPKPDPEPVACQTPKRASKPKTRKTKSPRARARVATKTTARPRTRRRRATGSGPSTSPGS